MPRPTAFKYGTEVFERVYLSHLGTEPEAFAAAQEAVAPIMPAVKEELGRWCEPRDSGSHATALRRETDAARKGGRA